MAQVLSYFQVVFPDMTLNHLLVILTLRALLNNRTRCTNHWKDCTGDNLLSLLFGTLRTVLADRDSSRNARHRHTHVFARNLLLSLVLYRKCRKDLILYKEIRDSRCLVGCISGNDDWTPHLVDHLFD